MKRNGKTVTSWLRPFPCPFKAFRLHFPFLLLAFHFSSQSAREMGDVGVYLCLQPQPLLQLALLFPWLSLGEYSGLVTCHYKLPLSSHLFSFLLPVFSFLLLLLFPFSYSPLPYEYNVMSSVSIKSFAFPFSISFCPVFPVSIASRNRGKLYSRLLWFSANMSLPSAHALPF